MSDDPHQPPTDPSAPDLTKAQAPAHAEPTEQRESIWRPLDGSEPPAPTGPAPAPSQFRKPEPRPLTFPSAPAEAAPRVDPQTGRSVFVLAGWLPRLGAYLLDNIFFSVILLILTIPAGVALGMTLEESSLFFTGNLTLPDSVSEPAVPWAIFGVQVLLQATLPAIFLARWNGQTPGKRIVGLRVVPEDGSPMTLALALKRELLGKTLIVGALGIITFGIAFLANYLWPLRDAQNRAGHDVFAKTRVVTAPRDS